MSEIQRQRALVEFLLVCAKVSTGNEQRFFATQGVNETNRLISLQKFQPAWTQDSDRGDMPTRSFQLLTNTEIA